MKTISKILSVVLALTMVLGLAGMVSAAEANEASVEFTADSLGLQSQAYSAGTATVGGVAVEWIQLGNYGDGIQMRDKNGNTSMFWNTAALSGGITKIELVYSDTKDVTHSNNNAVIFNFGNEAKGAAYSTKLSTVAGDKTYTITPDANTYTYFYIEHDLGYSMYWKSIKVYYAAGPCAHTYTDCDDTTCNLCGEPREAVEHKYDGCEDTDCNVCSKPRTALTHAFTQNPYRCDNCDYVKYPVADSTLTLTQAAELGASMNSNAYTTNKYYVEGVVKSVASTTYGNMTIEDAAGNTLYIYGVYSADGETRYDALETAPKVGDTVKLYGVIGQYNNIPQMKSAWLAAHTPTTEEAPVAPEDPKQIVAEAYALKAGEALPYTATLTGKIVSVDTPYSDDYKNITVTIAIEGCEDKPIQCYRLKGDGANALAAGDTVTVTGAMINYNGKIQFNSGCTLDKVVAGTRVPATGDVSVLMPAAAMLISGISTVALIIKKKEF